MIERPDEFRPLSAEVAQPGSSSRATRVGEHLFEGQIELRPRGVGALLDLGIDLVKSRFASCFLLGTVLWFPWRLLTLYVAPDPALAASGRPEDVFNMLGLTMVVNGLTWIATSMVTAFAARIVFDAARGVDTGVGAALQHVVRRLPGVLVLGIVSAILLLMSFVACFFPAIGMAWAIAPLMFVYILEDRPIGESLSRSFSLSFETLFSWPAFYGFWRWAGLSTVGAFLLLPLSGLVGAVEEPTVRRAVLDTLSMSDATLDLVSLFVGSLFLGVATAVQTGVMTAYYLDLRVRRDGFGLEALIERVSAGRSSVTRDKGLAS